MTSPHKHLGKLIGNTGNSTSLNVAIRGSFSARCGDFVCIPHTERRGENETDCLGRITNISRSNILLSEALGEGGGDVNVLPGSRDSSETLYLKACSEDFRDNTGQTGTI